MTLFSNHRIQLRGFTLIELLVVLVIVGILVLLAIPNLMPLISKAKSTEAQLQLEHLHALEKTHYYLHSKYTEDFIELGFEQAILISEGGSANYRIELLSISDHNFLARAISVADFDGDGVFNTWEINQDKQLIETVKD